MQGGKEAATSQRPWRSLASPTDFAGNVRRPDGHLGRFACLSLQFVLNIRNVCLFLLLLIWQ